MKRQKFKAQSIDDYLAVFSAPKRAALQKIRAAIRSAAPRAEECISYQLPAFRLDGKMLVAFGATGKHCAFYPMSANTVEAHKHLLESYSTSKGTIRFATEKPLSAALVKKLVKARILENASTGSVKRPSSRKTTPSKKFKENRTALSSRKRRGNESGIHAGASEVDAFLAELTHPRKKELEAVRRVVLAADSTIREGIKWNAPSFRTDDYFATLNLRGKSGEERVWLILHTGAVKKGIVMQGQISDPTGLLQWLAKDRCLVNFDSVKHVEANRLALQSIIRQWIERLKAPGK